jgi:predicted DNA-binding WGR domain protein
MLVRVEDRKMTRRFVRGDWFWEVTLEATTVRKRSGKVGTGGQELVSRFDTPAEANVACQDAVAQHVKAGYLPVDGNPERDGPYLDDGTWIRLEDEAGRFREALCEGVRLLQRCSTGWRAWTSPWGP